MIFKNINEFKNHISYMVVSRFFLILICLILCNEFSFGYQWDGFSEYQETDKGVSFECKEKCDIILGERGKAEMLKIDGSINGTGIFNILAKRGGDLYFLYGDSLSFTGNASVTFPSYEILLYNIPKDGNLTMEFSGNIKGALKVNIIIFPFIQKIRKSRKDFWKMENLSQMSIMKRYGVTIRGVSIITYGYIIFIGILIFVLFLKKNKTKKFKTIFYVGLGLFLFIGLRNTITYTFILKEGLHGYKTNNTYFDFQDYIPFVTKVRSELKLDNFMEKDCSIFLNINKYNRAIDYHGEFFFKPCKRVFSGYLADYIIYYDKRVAAEDLNKKILVEYNGNYLLENNPK